jgi:hypothetical protein
MQPSTGIVQAVKCGLMVIALAGIARADGGDVSGTYDAAGRTIHLLAGKGELVVSYSDQFGQGRTCTCLARAHNDGTGRFRFDEDEGLSGVVEIDEKQVKFDLSGPPDCCGTGWPGLPVFDVAGRTLPSTCTVKASRAYFYGDSGKKRGAYVMRGDLVDVVAAPGDMAAGFWLARYSGKKTTIGLLRRGDLKCEMAAARNAGR